jgi:hypothetical protein
MCPEMIQHQPDSCAKTRVILLVFVACILAGCNGGGQSSAAGGGAGGGGGGGGADTTNPTVAITVPTTNLTFTAGSASIDLGGTASDNIGVTQVTWSNNRGGNGTATGTSSWTANGIGLQTGTNTITITARDAAALTASTSLIVSLNAGPAKTYFISPTGSNANSGLLSTAAWKTFAKAFSTMAGGDELILLDGTYSAAAGTGIMHWDTGTFGAASAQPPSGTSLSAMTYVHALNPGSVTINGELFIGRSTRKDSFIKIQGITFEVDPVTKIGGGQLYNADYVTIKECGFHGGFGIGTNDHDQFADNNLIEDVWIWAAGERIIAINYRSHNNVWRRVVVRGDGCGTASCTGSGNPNVGITVYDSNNISLQNVIVVDRVLAAGDESYSDFAVAQHTPDVRYYFGQNEWLGTLSLKAPDAGYQMEPDAGATLDPTIKISNAVAFNPADLGFNLARAGTNNLLENLTVVASGFDGIRVAPELTTGIVRNAIVAGAGNFGINSKYKPTFVDVFNTAGGDYNQTTCTTGCLTSNPRADGSLQFLTRIETGSTLKGAGFGGADIGANILFRYGADGTRVGENNYNTLSAVSLWPWPNQDRIKKEMCVESGVTRGFCATGKQLDGVKPVTLTSYIWEALGNQIPAGVDP